nr:DUF2845 domain-containing protein [Chitinivorax sp. B]
MVDVGTRKYDVKLRCGEPAMVETIWRKVPITCDKHGKPGETSYALEPIDRWTYNPGPGQFITYLDFEEGEVKTIRYGSRIR